MKKQTIANIALLVCLGSIISLFSLSYILIPQKSFSEDENRSLQVSPRFTFEKLLDGTYTRQLHDYYSDQIALRSSMVELKSLIELCMGKNENNGVLLGKDNYLIETYSYSEDNIKYLKNNLTRIEKLMASIEQNGAKVSSVIIPRKVDVLEDKFPPYYSNERNDAVWNLVGDQHISLKDEFIIQEQLGIEMFYKTDHHWTDRGAHCAYKELASLLNFDPLSYSYFSSTVLSDEFYGTSYSTSGFFFAEPDTIYAPTIKEGRYVTTIVDIDLSFDGVYDTDYLSKKDKYSTFLSGNNAHVKITDTEDTEKETLLIIKDSYSHSLVPYLIEHYNIELIDPRYYAGSIEEYITENEIKNILFLFGIDTLASANLSIR